MSYYHELTAFEDWDAHVQAVTELVGKDPLILKALTIVKKYHDQSCMYYAGNYNRHPVRVARILAQEMNITKHETILIALFHDLGEWSDFDISQLSKEFGEQVFTGVKTLTWDQKSEWSTFVHTITNSEIEHILDIKIADKLDNNRAMYFSSNREKIQKAIKKSENVMHKIILAHNPGSWKAYEEILGRLHKKLIEFERR